MTQTLVPTMRAGREILRAFTARPRLFHRVVSTRPGWRAFEGFCRGTQTPDDWLRRRAVRAGLALLIR